MRMKEDAMLNGQLKPAYNVQHGVDAEYITWLDISFHPTDALTLIPFLKDMEEHLPFKYKEITADAGYESEENYVFIEENGQKAYINIMPLGFKMLHIHLAFTLLSPAHQIENTRKSPHF